MQRSHSTTNSSDFHTFILDFPDEYDQILVWPEVEEFSIALSQPSSTDDDDNQLDDEYSNYTDSTLDDNEPRVDIDERHEAAHVHAELHQEDYGRNMAENGMEQDYPIPYIVGYDNPIGHIVLDNQGIEDNQQLGGNLEPTVERSSGNVYTRVLGNVQTIGSSSISMSYRNLLLFRIISSTEEPLIRADINWSRALEEIPSYPAAAIGDITGLVLLEATLRMDPPLNVIEAIVSKFPQSCYNMDCFYASCLHSSSSAIVRFIMEQTMTERKRRGISWGMLAFLGDARINTRQATYLIESEPNAIKDHNYGELGICPLDRMLSGSFIHGCSKRWVQKLKLALLFSESQGTMITSSPTNDSEVKVPTFYFYHALVRRLISSDFKGMQYGTFNFLRSLDACIKASNIPLDAGEKIPHLDRYVTNDESAYPFHERDNLGRLPLHVILESPCETNLGIAGERKLIQFLLSVYPESAKMSAPVTSSCQIFTPSSVTYSERHVVHRKSQWLPLQMSIVNGWPCYDLLASANPLSVSDPKYNNELDDRHNLALHTVLSSTYSPRFGIKGARRIIQYFLRKNPQAAITTNCRGRFPLHLAIENGWPVHDLIISMAPAALDQIDGWSMFYPFQVAASFGIPRSRWIISRIKKRKRRTLGALPVDEGDHSKDISLSHLSLIYELIREAPLSCHGLVSDP